LVLDLGAGRELAVPAGADDRELTGAGPGGAGAGIGIDVRPSLQDRHQVIAPVLVGEPQDPRALREIEKGGGIERVRVRGGDILECRRRVLA
jgi:hypothetical protein